MNERTLALLAAAALTAVPAVAVDLSTSSSAAQAHALQRAEILAARQSWSGAVAAYEEAIAANPRDASLHNRLGICHQRQGAARAARREYRKAVALRADYAEAWNNLGTLETARGKHKQAIAHYSRAIQLKPRDAVFHKNLGAAWLARGDAQKALEAWGEAFRLDPAVLDGEALTVPASGLSLARQCYLYAKLLAAQGRVEQALEYLAKAQAAGFREFARLESDRDFATLVADPRYAAFK